MSNQLNTNNATLPERLASEDMSGGSVIIDTKLTFLNICPLNKILPADDVDHNNTKTLFNIDTTTKHS